MEIIIRTTTWKAYDTVLEYAKSNNLTVADLKELKTFIFSNASKNDLSYLLGVKDAFVVEDTEISVDIGEVESYSNYESTTLSTLSKTVPINVQTNRSTLDNWGLARISRNGRNLKSFPVSSTFELSDKECITDVAIFDTGVLSTHAEFENRVIKVFPNDTVEDKNGHGTHCASISTGRHYGVSRKSKILDFKVLDDDGKGQATTFLSGMNELVKFKKKYDRNIVASMSLSFKISATNPFKVIMQNAINSLINEGILVVASAGNDATVETDSGTQSLPAMCTNVVSVSSIDIADRISSFSNTNTEYNFYAPGTSIAAAYVIEDKPVVAVLNGTSMACPFVSGIIAANLDKKITNAAGAISIYNKIKEFKKDSPVATNSENNNIIQMDALDEFIVDRRIKNVTSIPYAVIIGAGVALAALAFFIFS